MAELKRLPTGYDDRGPQDRSYEDDPLVELARIVSGGAPFPEPAQRARAAAPEPRAVAPEPQPRAEIGRQPMPNQLSALEQELFSELRSTVDPDRTPRARVQPAASAAPPPAPQPPAAVQPVAQRAAMSAQPAPQPVRREPAPAPSQAAGGDFASHLANEQYRYVQSGVAAGSYDPAFDDFFDEPTQLIDPQQQRAGQQAPAAHQGAAAYPGGASHGSVGHGQGQGQGGRAQGGHGPLPGAQPGSQRTAPAASDFATPPMPPSVDSRVRAPQVEPTFGEFGREEIAAAAREAQPYLGGAPTMPEHPLSERSAARHVAREPRRGLMAAGVALGVFVLGGLGFLGWRAFATPGDGGTPPLIAADPKPMKVKPEGQATGPSGPKLTTDGTGEDKSRLVTRQEEPLDQVAGRTQDGRNVRVIPGAPNSAVAEQPRTVRTVVVRPDGTIVPSGDPARTVTTTPVRVGEPALPPGPAQPVVSLPPRANDPIAALSAPKAPSTGPVTSVGSGAPPLPAAGPAPVTTATTPPPATPKPVVPTPVTAPPSANLGLPGTPPAPPKPVVAPKPAVASQPLPAATGAPLALGAVPPTRLASNGPAATTSTPAPAVVAPPAPISAPPPAASGDGAWAVQLAAAPSDAEARRVIADAQRKFSGVLGGRSTYVQVFGSYHRARVAAGSESEAKALCEQIKSQGGACFTTRR